MIVITTPAGQIGHQVLEHLLVQLEPLVRLTASRWTFDDACSHSSVPIKSQRPFGLGCALMT